MYHPGRNKTTVWWWANVIPRKKHATKNRFLLRVFLRRSIAKVIIRERAVWSANTSGTSAYSQTGKRKEKNKPENRERYLFLDISRTIA